MKLFYTDHFELPLPSNHRFPMAKYRLLRDRMVLAEQFSQDVLLVPSAATRNALNDGFSVNMAGGTHHAMRNGWRIREFDRRHRRYPFRNDSNRIGAFSSLGKPS